MKRWDWDLSIGQSFTLTGKQRPLITILFSGSWIELYFTCMNREILHIPEACLSRLKEELHVRFVTFIMWTSVLYQLSGEIIFNI